MCVSRWRGGGRWHPTLLPLWWGRLQNADRWQGNRPDSYPTPHATVNKSLRIPQARDPIPKHDIIPTHCYIKTREERESGSLTMSVFGLLSQHCAGINGLGPKKGNRDGGRWEGERERERERCKVLTTWQYHILVKSSYIISFQTDLVSVSVAQSQSVHHRYTGHTDNSGWKQ